MERRLVEPEPWPDDDRVGYPSDHPYVRRYWTAVLGPGAVADLLRLATAAQRGRSLRRPVNLASLTRAGLVRHSDGRILVRTVIPPVPVGSVRRMHPVLRDELMRRDANPMAVPPAS